jgi:DNA-binding transcriptional LysR family regulator
VSADPEHVREPMTIERLAAAPLILYDARWGADDPMRRQLRERAQRAGVKLEPQIEVEYVTLALELCARGLGDTVSSRLMVRTRGYGRKLAGVSCDPPLYDTFAFITRRNAHVSPATRAFIALAEKRVQGLARQLDAGDR